MTDAEAETNKLGTPIKETNGIKYKNIEAVGTEPK